MSHRSGQAGPGLPGVHDGELLRLRREFAEKRIFPAVDVVPSGTRRDDLLMLPAADAALGKLRRALAGLEPQQALGLLLDKTRETSSNAEFLRQVQQSAILNTVHPKIRQMPPPARTPPAGTNG